MKTKPEPFHQKLYKKHDSVCDVTDQGKTVINTQAGTKLHNIQLKQTFSTETLLLHFQAPLLLLLLHTNIMANTSITV